MRRKTTSKPRFPFPPFLPVSQTTPFRFRQQPRGLKSGGPRRNLIPFRRWPALDYLGTDMPLSLGRMGSLEVRLARNAAEIREAQALRYHVFYEEKNAIPNLAAQMNRRDEDAYDQYCNHILVIDHAVNKRRMSTGFKKKPMVVGTYRLLHQDTADRHCGFYSATEYDISALLNGRPEGYRFLELGRTCVLKEYRTKRTIEVLWQGVWNFVRMRGADAFMGCASLDGADPSQLALELSFLYHTCLAPPEWRAEPIARRRQDMNLMPAAEINARQALRLLPPLLKSYVRMGVMIGDGAVVDHQFGTTDVFAVVPIKNINPRYFDRFGAPDEQPF